MYRGDKTAKVIKAAAVVLFIAGIAGSVFWGCRTGKGFNWQGFFLCVALATGGSAVIYALGEIVEILFDINKCVHYIEILLSPDSWILK